MAVTKILNVDLDIRAKSGLEELIESFDSAVIVLNQEEGFVSLEMNSGAGPQSIEEAILYFHDLIGGLPQEMRDIWNQCEMRCFNIGIQAGTISHSKEFYLSNDLLRLLSSINVDVVFTVYAEGVIEKDRDCMKTK